MHLFLELCKEPGTPASSWNYREESFGGSISHQSHHRGGVSSPLSMSKMVLMKFCAKEKLPILRALIDYNAADVLGVESQKRGDSTCLA